MEDGFQQALSLQEGRVLAERYRVGPLLSLDGVGASFSACDLELGTTLALRCVRPRLLGDAQALARFLSEARIATQLANEHLERIFDVGTLPSGIPFVVTELLGGSELGTWVRVRGPLAVADAVDFVLQACEGLAGPHLVGLVHRYLAPERLFRVERPDGEAVIKVIDFGIPLPMRATMSANAGAEETRDDGVPPSAAETTDRGYLAPEQRVAGAVGDARADIWALGLVLSDLVTGREARAHVSSPPPSIEVAEPELAPSVAASLLEPPALPAHLPAELASVIRRCLHWDRDARYSNVVDLAQALLPFGSPRGVACVSRLTDSLGLGAVVASAEASLSSEVTYAGAPVAKRSRQSTVAAIVAMVSVVLVGTGLLSHALGSRRSALPPASQAPSQEPSLALALARPAAVVPPPPIAASAFVVPNSATIGERPHADSSLSPGPSLAPPSLPASFSTVAPADGGRAAARSRRRSGRDGGRGDVGLARSGTPAGPLADLQMGAPGVAVSGGAANRRQDSDSDCRASFDFDEQGRRHFKSSCATPPRTAALGSGNRATPDCNPSFELDDQGRKHFKPECFLKQK